MDNMVRTCSRIKRVVALGSHDPFDIFQSFCDGSAFGGGSRGGPRQRSGDDVVDPLKVSLEDLYFGTFNKLSLSWNVICSKCNGLVKICKPVRKFMDSGWFMALDSIDED